ncbi:hypothetical protein DFJ43DRAFT_1040152 [Lentinula guzmanii]|uniref:Uncharacterized protein n=1 Tax=Lentinula guzmanii TaxID=2804957 RepID=A0AA38JEK0_9AGAR|nr:hypothetical protein DFJ43DRAFT_1040152 [Lentinula guzmanii]
MIYTRQFRMDFSRDRTSSSKVLVRDSEGWYFAMNTEEVNAPGLFMGSSSRRGNDLVPKSEDSGQRCGSTTDMQSVTSGDPVSPPVSPSVSSPVSPPWESRTTTSENAARLSKEMDTPISLVVSKPSMSDIDSRLLDPLDGSHDTNCSQPESLGSFRRSGTKDLTRHKSVDDVRAYIILFHAITVSVSQLDSDGPKNPELNNDRFATFWNDVLWTMFLSKSFAMAAGNFALSVGIFALVRYQVPKQVQIRHKVARTYENLAFVDPSTIELRLVPDEFNGLAQISEMSDEIAYDDHIFERFVLGKMKNGWDMCT